MRLRIERQTEKLARSALASTLTLIGIASFAQAADKSLDAALGDYAARTGTQLVYRTEITKGLLAPIVPEGLSSEEELQVLLKGTGLDAQRINEHTLTIRRAGEVQKISAIDAGSSNEPGGSLLRLAQLSDQSTDAQEGAAPNARTSSAASDDSRLEEVIVTARKQTERLQQAPVTVTAITSEELENSGATDIKDILLAIPGLSYSGEERASTRYNIRGVSNAAEIPTVGIFIDDVSLVQLSQVGGGFNPLIFDIDRVEVLKGPQGTLFGGSAMGGAIRYVTRRPDATEQDYRVALGMSQTEHGSLGYNAEGVFNIPLIQDVLAVRGGVMFGFEPGYIDNVANGLAEVTNYSSTPFPDYTPLLRLSRSEAAEKDYNSTNNYLGRLSLLWTPSDSTSLRLTAFHQNSNQANPSYVWTSLPAFQSSYRFTNSSTEDQLDLFSAEFNQDLGPVALTSLTAYSDRQIEWYRDYSFFLASLSPLVNDFDTPNYSPTYTETFSQEVRLASADPNAAFTFVVGGFASLQDEEFRSNVIMVNGEQSIFGTSAIYIYRSFREQDEYALFGEANYRILDNLTLNAGVRFYKNSVTFESESDGFFAGGPTAREAEFEEDGVNPRFGISYEVNDRHLLYTSAARGFRPGSALRFAIPADRCAKDLALLGYDDVPQTYQSDNVWTYELGSKNEFSGGRGVLNASVFRTDWSDVQQSVSLPNCGSAFVTNAGAATVQGLEIEARFNITPSLEIGGSTAYTDSEITDPAFGPFNKGDQIQDVPEWMVHFYASYTRPVSDDWNLELRSDYSYRSETRRTPDNNQLVFFPTSPGVYDQVNGPFGFIPNGTIFQDAYDVVNARAILSDGDTSVRFFVNNVFDVAPALGENYELGSAWTMTLRPRTIGVEFRQNF